MWLSNSDNLFKTSEWLRLHSLAKTLTSIVGYVIESRIFMSAGVNDLKDTGSISNEWCKSTEGYTRDRLAIENIFAGGNSQELVGCRLVRFHDWILSERGIRVSTDSLRDR